MNSWAAHHGNQVQAIHRPMGDMVSLPEALASVGFRCSGLPWVTDTSPKLVGRLTGLIKTALGFKLSIGYTKAQPYRILIYKIHRLLWFQVSNYPNSYYYYVDF